MDNLARNAMLARQANMTYGKWKALQYDGQQKPKTQEQEEVGFCLYCKKPFKKKNRRKLYCDDNCSSQAYYYRNIERCREKNKQYRQRKAAERDGKL